jgi:Invasin, domain 3/IPT/TIG domain
MVRLEELEERVVPTLLGQQIFPADYPWNQNIANAPVAANSAAIIAHIGNSVKIHPDWGADSPSNGNSPLYGIPFNVVHGNSPTVTKVNVIIDNYPGESDIEPVPIPANAVIEGDYQNGPNLNGGGYNSGQRGDSHLIVWDEDNNIAYELFGVTRPTDPTLFPNTNGVELPHTDGLWHAAQETVWNMNTDDFRALGDTSADAAGLSILAGLARPDEGLPTTQGGQGAIDHALRLTLPSGDVNPQYIYPASHVVSDSSGSTKLPFGARLRLMNTPAVDAVISTLGPEAQIIAQAMQQYGLVLADIGSAMYVTGTSASQDANNNISLTWNMNDVLGLRALTASDFQVVNLTPQVTGFSASSGAAGSTITVIGQNFSGAAGHLTVDFGSTASTSVTYVDDAHITAVVPQGSGTVNVTVQSGVNETDPNNPNDNVNNPIFGYGTSPVSTADQFTIGTPTVSAANSRFNFTSPVVVLGKTDKLMIILRDATGNAVTGLSNSAFSFALSGGTSVGTFGTVTETTDPGTYTVVFTATVAGTASTVSLTAAGVTLTDTRTITVLARPIQPPPGGVSIGPAPPPANTDAGANVPNAKLQPTLLPDGGAVTATDGDSPSINGGLNGQDSEIDPLLAVIDEL